MDWNKINEIDAIFLRIMGGMILATLAFLELALIKYIFS